MDSMRPLTYRYLIAIIFVGLIFSSCDEGTKMVDWSRNYKTTRKSPFGLFILAKEIETMKNGFAKVEKVNIGIRDYIDENTNFYNYSGEDKTLFYIDDEVQMQEITMNRIMSDFVAPGNQALISVHDMPATFFGDNVIELETSYNLSNAIVFSLEGSTNTFKVDDKMEYVQYFKFIDTFDILPLGYVQPEGIGGQKYCNFFAMSHENGYLFVHAAPEMFSNYSFLNWNNAKYVEGVLSNLNREHLVWFHNYSLERDENKEDYGLLSYLLSQPGLTSAWYMLWVILLIFAFSQVKRRQRVIPIKEAKKNFSLDYVKRMSQFHLLEKNYHGLIETQILLILDKLRTEYRMDTTHIDKTFAERMTKATNCDPEGAQEFVRYLEKQKLRTVAFSFDFEELMKILNKLNLK
jgi:hypothetical protein